MYESLGCFQVSPTLLNDECAMHEGAVKGLQRFEVELGAVRGVRAQESFELTKSNPT